MKILNGPSLVLMTALFVIAESAYGQQPPDVLVSAPRENTVMGGDALLSLTPICSPSVNPAGYDNAASGWQALMFNTIGFWNPVNGAVLAYTTTGNSNTVAGRGAPLTNSTGSCNIAEGLQGGINLTTGNYDIDIGNPRLSRESEGIRIGTQVPTALQTDTNIAVIFANTMVSSLPVVIDSTGQLGVTFSFLGALQNLP
jgi:hypothetical protein